MLTLPDDLAQYLATEDGRAAQPEVAADLVRLRTKLGYPLDSDTYSMISETLRKAARTTALAAAEQA